MFQYDNFEVEDFAQDDSFIRWVLYNEKEDAEYWNNIKKKFPHKLNVIEEAAQLVTDLHEYYHQNEINNHIDLLDKKIVAGTKLLATKKRKTNWYLKFAAASIILLLFSSIFFKNKQKTEDLIWTSHYNNSHKKLEYILSDNSTIVLEPFSSISYPEKFGNEQRIVVLNGQAFFKVTKDSLRPFLVYANETITKVLGTSFTITAFEGQENVQVEVSTGKVAVYGNIKSDKVKSQESLVILTDKKIKIPKPNVKFELTPNQKVILDYQNNIVKKTLVDTPVLLLKENEEIKFNFINENVSKVFDALSLAYGININYKMEEIRNCKITTKLADEPLVEKILVICSALDLRFKEEDGNIYIYGNGCS